MSFIYTQIKHRSFITKPIQCFNIIAAIWERVTTLYTYDIKYRWIPMSYTIDCGCTISKNKKLTLRFETTEWLPTSTRMIEVLRGVIHETQVWEWVGKFRPRSQQKSCDLVVHKMVFASIRRDHCRSVSTSELWLVLHCWKGLKNGNCTTTLN